VDFFLNPVIFAGIFLFSLVLLGWFIISRLGALRGAQSPGGSLWILQQEIEQLRGQLSQALNASAERTQAQLGQILNHVSDRLKENAEMVQQSQHHLGERLDGAARLVGQMQKSLGSLEEASRRIFDIGKDISSLQEILRAPKLRGGLGEFFLEDMLRQVLPARHFTMQHRFKSGEKVDAVIRLGDGLVPVDSKFPLENFRRAREASGEDERARAQRQFAADVRKHIDVIAAKYILPDEGTYDFALMYIPAEAVYYETVIEHAGTRERNLGEYALGRRVIPVSPSSFYAYLQALVVGLRGMKIEERAREMARHFSQLQGDVERFGEEFAVLGRHLSHAQSAYQSSERRLDQVAQKLRAAVADGENARVAEGAEAELNDPANVPGGVSRSNP
jgi:DNA recombination protein RmuC